MAKSTAGKAKSAARSQSIDANASPYSGLMAEIDEQLAVIRNSEADAGDVEHATRYLRTLMATTRFKMAISNHQIRMGIAGRLPF
jgi:hypothetical protein